MIVERRSWIVGKDWVGRAFSTHLWGRVFVQRRGWGGDGENWVAFKMPCLHFPLTTNHFPLPTSHFPARFAILAGWG
ncbi:hypothetical protein Dxin01_01087 [Deinococcus xinjiangensis]|uniref:Uncharacterized protein n=1 Tax=Deinococcus xinjiangensis TaxID=457454 RepID=A0ABP9VA05_9DEIO